MISSLTEPIHRSTCRVIYGDTDAGRVVYNANYLRYFEIGRTEFMRELVCSYRDIEELGLVLPVTECYLRFKAPAFYDDLLTIETSLTELKSVSCRFCYKITRTESERKRPVLLAKGFTVHAAVNREGRLAKLPDEIVKRLKELL
ncbi:MAG: thioesterase family protein [Desulfocapsaceae bacterium]|nr:thioesterase family protein [Desulfocapsaceae bacterium]